MGHFITKINFYLGEDQEAPVIGLEETHAQDQKNVAEGKKNLPIFYKTPMTIFFNETELFFEAPTLPN